ncbi:DNA polymerase II small subunit [Thermococcus sp. 4557]|uniref:DNA-directed DNA polymerase II small subunit n=1 Tax=Thermococcus sp. (strain CGMCC 1.5172 / 4557) TaxID=1042877 RepID=UPI000219EAD4|nr:DNA-directed DNA polymerase II small subunit [Thermococcus sp. 4557]AEK73338.1 DNA polymerase II small subunit [Thermococcus sp. 4557]
MGLIEDLMANRYLITPSAYYLLVDSYKKDFTLAELIKFARARGTFVIDSAIAKEFLSMKAPAPLEPTAGEGSPERREVAEEIPLESGGTGELSEESPDFAENTSDAAPVAESADMISPPEEASSTYISTGTPIDSVVETASFGESEQEEPGYSEGGSFISTGTPSPEGDGGASVEENVSSETPDGEASPETFPVENGAVSRSEPAAEGPALPSGSAFPENGNGYADDESYYSDENGNGVKPKIVYGDYGVPIAYVGEEVPEEKSYSTYADVVIAPREGFHYRAREIKDDWELVFDVKNVKFEVPKVKSAASKEGEIIVKVYSDYFKSRLRKMRRILRENPELGSVIDIGKLGYVGGDEEVTIIGLINSKRETAKGYMFEVEDSTGIIKVFINRNNEESKKFFQIMPDSVVAFRGRYSGRGIFFANRIYLPDVPKFKRDKPPLEEKVYAILLSDIHVGSNKFCEKAFERFLEWLNGEVNNRAEEELVSRIKYMIIAGDVVDGIGIYPGQYNELEIPDIFDQYEALANLLRNVPDHITMFIGPGNHDAARTALPQPGFYDEYARPLKKLKNAVMISNPAVVRLHGRDFLIAHGRGIEDVVSFIPNRSHHRPAEAMLDLLKLRHLAPTFGEKVPVAPDSEDTLVIESVPDLFQAGHVHVMEYKMYNGVFLINTGTWQAQTEFQKMVNIMPTPARVPIIDVETARLRAVVRFDEYCEGV